MVAVINVFYRGKKVEDSFIKCLVDNEFVHYVDSVRFKDPNWIRSNTQNGYIYRYKEGQVCRLSKDEYDIEGPGVFMLIVDTKEENPFFYEDVEEFILSCFDGTVGLHIEKYRQLLDMFKSQKEKLPEQKVEKRSIDETEEDLPSTDYSFDFKKFENLDCIFYQLTKPNTDRPYVVLVNNFSKHGHRRLFSSMKLFDSWGVSKYDITFLVKLWEYLLGGEHEFEKVTDEHIQDVLDGKEDEPKVWRKNIELVINDYMRKNKSF